MSSPRPAHPGTIIPRSSRRLERTILDAWLTGGAAQSARTALPGAVVLRNAKQHEVLANAKEGVISFLV